ncbi:MAG: ankyrin repeat domain-containing protein [Rhodocyclales bacterium]|nr:ankyrin repeat domain-containing protein [Rhodocyclales bacterium]
MKRTLIPLLFGLLLSPVLAQEAGRVAPAAAVLGANDQPIHDAARLGSGKDVEKILKAAPAMRDARTQHGSTPLHLAATNPDISALKALLAAGADVNARDSEGLTPLHMTAYTQNARHAELLLQAGADPYAKTNAGRDPTSMARKTRSDEVSGVISLWILKGCKAGKPC